MSDVSDLQPADLGRMVAASLEGALNGMVSRSTKGDRMPLIITLRAQMTQILAHAPIKGDPVKAMALRGQMAALLNAEFSRLEAVERLQAQG